MANNPSTLPGYNGQVAAPDANYTYGSARNDAAPGDLTGTPRIAAEINDIMGFQQALLNAASIIPSGNPDTVLVSQYLQALNKVIQNFHDQLNPATLAIAIADPDLKVGDIVTIQDPTGAWKIITKGTTPDVDLPDGTKIVASTGNTAQALFFLGSAFIDNESLGSPATGPLSVKGGAVRITNNGEAVDNTGFIIDDAEHDPINSTGVIIGLNTITINHDKPAGSDVVGATLAVPDETLVQRGIMVGGSIATDVSIITMTKRHQFKIDWTAGALDINNLIVDAFMDSTRYVSVDNTGGNGAYRIVHPRTTDGIRTINPQNLNSPDSFITELSDTTIDIFPYKDITIKCVFNGATWAVTGITSALTAALATVGVTCASAGNLITVTHPATLGTSSFATATAGPATDFFFVNIFSESTTTTVVTLNDDTGAGINPSSGDEFYINLNKILWKEGFSIVDLGIIRVSPTLDFKDIDVANNFWFLGVDWPLK